ncbi:MAG: hypothetical protein ACRDKB_11080, partial [Actinomycetota bacterium]
MDVISWVVALVAGAALPSLRTAAAIGAGTSVAIRVYQYLFTEPRVWGHTLPADLLGAVAMIAVTLIFAWIGSIARVHFKGR